MGTTHSVLARGALGGTGRLGAAMGAGATATGAAMEPGAYVAPSPASWWARRLGRAIGWSWARNALRLGAFHAGGGGGMTPTAAYT
jgi:hypothetical protein